MIHKIIILVITQIIIATLWVGFTVYSYSFADYTKSADAAVVLGASVYGNQPSPVFRERINHAVNIYKKGDVHFIIATGGYGSQSKYSESMVAKYYMLQNGVPESAIIIEEKSQTTFQNLFYARAIAAKTGIKSFIIVSDPLHMKRAYMLSKELNMAAETSPTPSSLFTSWRSRCKMLFSEVFYYSIHVAKELFINPERKPEWF